MESNQNERRKPFILSSDDLSVVSGSMSLRTAAVFGGCFLFGAAGAIVGTIVIIGYNANDKTV
jgi:hypothetical protein